MENGNHNINDNVNDNSRKGSVGFSKSVDTYQKSAFGNNVFYALAKRAERTATAIHMVSNFIAKDDSLRNDVRRHSLRVIKNLYKCITCDAYDQQFFLEEALVNIEYVMTTMSIARTTGTVSEMNTEILTNALQTLGGQIYAQLQIALRYEQKFSETIAPTIDKETLLDFLQEAGSSAMLDDGFQQTLQDALTNKTTFKTTQNDTETKRQNKRHSNSQPSKSAADDRRIKIQEIISAKGDATIKDIATRITNCSEKTLQRDLVQLIKDNIIEKEGSKRWSVYRIKDNKNDIS